MKYRKFYWFMLERFLARVLLTPIVIGGVYALYKLISEGVPPLFIVLVMALVCIPYYAYDISVVEFDVQPDVIVLYPNPKKGDFT